MRFVCVNFWRNWHLIVPICSFQASLIQKLTIFVQNFLHLFANLREISAFFPKKIRPSYFPDKRINFELVENSSRFLHIPAINCISSQKADSYENFSLWFQSFAITIDYCIPKLISIMEFSSASDLVVVSID